MTEIEQTLASELLACPHCGKAPFVEVIQYQDDRSKWLEASYLRQMRLGQAFYRIECCTVLEGTGEWEDLLNVWNSRKDSSRISHEEIHQFVQMEVSKLEEVLHSTAENICIDRKVLENKLLELFQNDQESDQSDSKLSAQQALSEMSKMDEDFKKMREKVRKAFQRGVSRCSSE